MPHSLLGLAIGNADDNAVQVEPAKGSVDPLLQGHIFLPNPVADDPGAAVIRGAICSRQLYQRLHAGDSARARGGQPEDD